MKHIKHINLYISYKTMKHIKHMNSYVSYNKESKVIYLAIVLNFGQRITATVIGISAKKCHITDSLILDDCQAADLISQEATVNLLKNLIDVFPKAAAHKIYACFDATTDIAYKTFRQPQDSFKDHSLKKDQDKEDLVLRVCLETQPDGLLSIFPEYVPSVISCHEDESENILTASYLPKVYVDNLVTACEATGLSLVKITDTAAAITNLLKKATGEGEILVVLFKDLAIAVTPFGCLPWIIPPDTDDLSPLTDSLGSFFPVTGEIKPVIITPQQNVEKQNTEEGGVRNFTSKLRQFFKKK